jgi:ADP-ribose pyrophosphatase YjhB (NUDIX family)
MNYWKELKITNKIKYISIIIYTIYQDEILVLVGKEFNNKPNKTDVGLYSDFSGKLDNEESISEAASRILFEKTMNMIIQNENFQQLIINDKIRYKINKNRIIFIYKIDYDQHKNLPTYFNNVFEYMNLCRTFNSMKNSVIETCPFDFFDKSELKWVNYEFINKNIKLFKKLFINNLNFP